MTSFDLAGFVILAEKSRFHAEPDRALNLYIYVFLALVVAGIAFWRTANFERVLRSESRSPREAWSGFVIWVAASVAASVGLGVAINFFNVRSLFLGG